MKFWLKVFLATIAVMAAAFGVMGYALVTASFEATLRREAQRCLDGSRMIEVVLTSAAPDTGRLPADQALSDLMGRVATGDFASARLYDRALNCLFGSERKGEASAALLLAGQSAVVYQIRERGKGSFMLETAAPLLLGGRATVLYTEQDISWVFRQRAAMFVSCAVITAIALFAAALVMAAVCALLTRPIGRLSAAANKIAAGEYGMRAPVIPSRDEVGALTRDFNRMADALCAHMEQLKEEARRREEFVASFAHELKTPLTSMIGYADMLRSQAMEPEQAFESANYIYSEGRRLEGLSLKLLELIVLGRETFPRKLANPRLLCEQAVVAAAPALKEKYGATLVCRAEDGLIMAEPGLMITLLINLLDNAAKASTSGQTVLLLGRVRPDGRYVLAVTDQGRGIPAEELSKITEAFYMVDKSRSRALCGAGLGLALSEQIAKIHGARLEFMSALGEGTTALLDLPMETEREASFAEPLGEDAG